MKIIISGVNLIEGGPLKVLQDSIAAFSKLENIELICLVNNRKLFEIDENINFIEFPWAKKNWLLRCFFEYIYCWFLSKKMRPDIWLAMHDMTPYLYCPANIKQYVYCHNPSPAYDATFKDFRFSKKFFLFSKLYKFLYRINIKSNAAVICQQKWIGIFLENLGASSVIVTKPNSINKSESYTQLSTNVDMGKDTVRIFYPALPRTFKNFELILDAIVVVEKAFTPLLSKKIEVIITIDATESKYAKWLCHKYSSLKTVKFVGRLDRKEVNSYYQSSDLVIFPSKLETWGLPIVEAKEFDKPIFLADLPYAHETLGTYDKAKFIDVNDPHALAKLIVDFVNDDVVYDSISFQDDKGVLSDWDELVRRLLLH
ncbi:glycosyltransferase [Aeromonas veronii]|uniref:glycosyltransferase n=1 Tax=Aeromonas veronii TaxID=654 RepID=UPI003D1C63BB